MSVSEKTTEYSGQQATQADLHYLLNERHSSIYILPPEVLSVIFRYACVSTPKRSDLLTWELPSTVDRTVFVLSAVSSYWRDIVHRTPSLWENLAIQPSQAAAAFDAILLQHYITLVGCLDFALDLLFPSQAPASNFEPISKVLFSPENTQKIKTLRLQDPPLCVIYKLSQFSQLHTLRMWFSICHPPYVNLDLSKSCPSLCRVSLEGTLWESVSLPLSVQALVLTHVSSEISISSLYQCPNLTECHQFHSDTYGANESPRRSLLHPLTLAHLEVWSWAVTEDVWTDDRSTPYLHLPALKTCLIWHDPIGASPEDVINFCHQFPYTLSSLELCGFVNWDYDSFKRLFWNSMPSVKVLRVTRCSPCSLSALARALTPDGVNSDIVKPLPRLRDLSATFDELYVQCDAETDFEYPALLSDMLEKRREGGSHQFRIQVPNVDFPQTADVRDGPD
ncbi:hypothetical protein P691DRAFT_310459 [Macrolepiota fuliginosa MF-IS2]|uniref:F-box domain-containing protein n=1 Tax=Macrolepiota fuliginosa MF-IS2 TaxID=1400762 RepID=A0A9P6C6Z8_9AGAR|nr:hypothetical protein P691DRAFT_310459 [Macrolepiota fuliginosa MF-IS2]